MPSQGEAIDGLAAGQADLVFVDPVPFLIAANASVGTPAEIRAIGAVAHARSGAPHGLSGARAPRRSVTTTFATNRSTLAATIHEPTVAMKLGHSQPSPG